MQVFMLIKIVPAATFLLYPIPTMAIHTHIHFFPQSPKHISFYTIIFLSLFTFPFITSQTQSDNTTFTFTEFSSGMTDIILEGDANYTENKYIQLTKSFGNLASNISMGRATYIKPLRLWDKSSGNLADFTTRFSFVINSRGNETRGSGMAFFLAPNDTHLPLSAGPAYLGLSSNQPNANTQRPNFVAVEFDTKWSGNFVDTEDEGEHIGIDIDTVASAKVVPWTYNDISNGGRIEARIDYNSSSKNLSVSVTNGYQKSYSKNHSYNLFYIVDLRERLTEWVTIGFSAGTGVNYFEEHEIYSWQFISSLQLEDDNLTNKTGTQGRNKGWIWAMVGAGGVLVLDFAVLGVLWYCYWMKRGRERSEDRITKDVFEIKTGPRSYSFDELVIATNNFSEGGLLGKGGFGKVYEGFLIDRGSSIAVKRINSERQEGLKAYASEVQAISRLRHKNLVQLLGWCRNKQEFFIIYEFMPNKSLDFHLFNKTGFLTWDKRYRIVLGLASALLYLQEDCDQCILHRDIKSSNVLLDANFKAKLGDFGLARLVEHGQEGLSTTRLIGTDGYVSPEYLETSKATKESDVYSFGIVALEIATGKPAFKQVEDVSGQRYKVKLVEWVWDHYGRGNIFAAADPQLGQDYVSEEMEKLIVVGLACAHPYPSHRPLIGEAIDVLNGKASLPVLPTKMPGPSNIASYQANVYAFSGFSSLGNTSNTKSSTTSDPTY